MICACPTVSIITPSFNHGPFIEATIRSVLAQDYQPTKYLIVDGGSTDGTLDVLRKYDGKIEWISEPDKGQADAINKGFARVPGDILGWLNSDDIYAPGALAAVADYFAAHPDVGVVYGNADFIDTGGNFIGHCQHIEPFNRHRLLHYCDFLVQPAAFFRREVFEKASGLDASLNWAMDYDFWLKASQITRFEYLPRTLANYRWLGDSKTSAGGERRLIEVEKVARRYGSKGLPAYFRLEAVRMKLVRAGEHARRFRFDLAARQTLSAAGDVCFSGRAMRSIFSLRTWRIIRMGQTLRNKKV